MATKKKAAADGGSQDFQIAAPSMGVLGVGIRGSRHLVLHKFSKESAAKLLKKHEAGETAKKEVREKKDVKKLCRDACYRAKAGWYGFPAIAIRKAMISACKIANYKMTKAKLSFDVIPDGYDDETGTPIVRITKGKHELFLSTPRNANGHPDVRARPRWNPGWEASVTVEYDETQFVGKDILHLLMRAGKNVGIGDGRPDSPKSSGCGWGLFELVGRP